MDVMIWTSNLAQRMIRLRDFVSTAMNKQDPYKAEGFFNNMSSNVWRNMDNNFVYLFTLKRIRTNHGQMLPRKKDSK